ARIAPWARTAAEALVPQATGSRPRISTCFLIDDYFTQFSSPAEVIPQLLTAAQRHGLQIDYLARESACARADGVALAELAAAWQLLRLGMVRNNGANVVHPVQHDGQAFPSTWAELPPITTLRANATPFCAHRTFSALPSRFLQVENAVRVILAQTAIQQE